MVLGYWKVALVTSSVYHCPIVYELVSKWTLIVKLTHTYAFLSNNLLQQEMFTI